MNGLTQRQADCLAAIGRLTVDGVPPSFNELADDLGLKSKSGIHRLLSGLQARGRLTWRPHAARSIYLLEEGLSPGKLHRYAAPELRTALAHIAGILAHRDGEAVTARTLHNIADALEHKPRRRAA